jgi:hypothetical protein
MLTLAGCGAGHKNDVGSAALATAPGGAKQTEFVATACLPIPRGVEPAVWQLITEEFERQLLALPGARAADGGVLLKTTSEPPRAATSQCVLSSSGSQLRWGFYSTGDYDQNGEVNPADLTPLAVNFHASALPGSFPANSVGAVVDGDGNGEINLGDVTPIVLNFHNSVAQYNIYSSKDPADYPADAEDDNGGVLAVDSRELAQALGEAGQARLQFTGGMADVLNGDYFWVRPADYSGVEGIASNLLGPVSNVYPLDGFIYIAGGGTDPLPNVPVALTGDAEANTVTDTSGHYQFDDLPAGDYTITPSGDPYGYSPPSISTSISNFNRTLEPIVQAPVDIAHRWGLDFNAPMFPGNLQLDDDGNSYLTGMVGYEGANRSYLFKLDMFGELIWSRAFSGQYDLGSIRAYLCPSADIYVAGVNVTGPGEFSTTHDLLFMKLDSLGNIVWQKGYSYPAGDLVERQDNIGRGFVDAQGNLVVYPNMHYTPPDSRSISYMLRISPDGEVLNQRLWQPAAQPTAQLGLGAVQGSPGGSALLLGGAALSTGYALLLNINPDGSIAWVNLWGATAGSLAEGAQYGADGFLYLVGNAYLGGITDQAGVQLTRFDTAGAADWDFFCNTEHPTRYTNDSTLAIGPQGMLWVAGNENVDTESLTRTTFPFVWSFQPEDGSPRFTKLWECDGNDRTSNETAGTQLAVNRYGVAVISADAPSHLGVWRDYDLGTAPADWTYSHPEFEFTAETPGPVYDPEVQQPSEGSVKDEEPAINNKHLILLYRP